ncbi:MAG: hypothetical protein JXR91_16395 [Deltaproteobacteria bacterium]|nr:hypothetical protein [Deltaproteobacteria bacterium]
MTIPGLIILNMLAGTSVAFSANIQIKSLQRPLFYNRYFTALLMLEIMVFLPAGIYFSGFYPDWSWMYLVNTSKMSPGISAMALLAYPATAIMGYLVGYFSAKSNSNWVSIMFMIFLIAGLLGLFIVGSEKLTLLGTYDQFSNNVNLIKWTESSLLASYIVAIIGILTGWGFILYKFWLEGHLTRAANKK